MNRRTVNRKMEIQDFISKVLEAEAEALTNKTVKDLDALNLSVEKLENFLHGYMTESISPGKRNTLLPDAFYAKKITHKPRHLFKISHYQHSIFGEISVVYLSYPNPVVEIGDDSIDEAFIVAKIEGEYKIIGTKSVALNDNTLERIGWERDMYNPRELDIENLGKFLSSERLHQPKDDGFSLQDYLEDK